MNDTERAEALERLRDFAGQQAAAGDLADRNSLDRAEDVMKLYDEKENGRRRWALEMGPPAKRRHAGKPVDPESFSRFTKWLAEQTPLGGRRAYQLKTAHELRTNYLNGVQIIPAGEYALRPLNWLIKNEHPEGVAEVWHQATALAGGQAPDSTTVGKALNAWKIDHGLKPTGSAGKSKPTGPEALRLEMEQLARRLMEEAPEQFLLGFDHIDAMASQRFSKAEANAA